MDEVDLAFETPGQKKQRLHREMIREIRWFFASFVVCISAIVAAAGYPYNFAEDYRELLAISLVLIVTTTFFLFLFCGLRWAYLDRQIAKLR